MFLFSGRGYWQEFTESILWAHDKIYIVPYLKFRALSIIQGRIIGLSHYALGSIGSIFSFFVSRILGQCF